jgi:hypothetical protein
VTLPFERARKLVYFPVPDAWVPSPEERLWLEELEALTDDEIRQLDRFSPVVAGVEVVPPDEL